MKNLRLILALPFLPFLFLGVLLCYIAGLPFVIIGGKPAFTIFDEVVKLIKD